jgi:aldehyde:ferredoxin oxidoreductase
MEEFFRNIAYRKDIGDVLAEGRPRAAEIWGRLEEDHTTGLVNTPLWGMGPHYDARAEVYWGYACLVSARDVNCHDFNVPFYRTGCHDIPAGREPVVPAKQIADWMGELPPYHDPDMADLSTDSIYSIHQARAVAWLLHYSRFWKQTCGLCDNAYADIVNPYGPNNRGLTPEGEVKLYKAVTGEDLSFEDSMELGRKQFNLNKAIWTLQGRHRDMEVYPDFVYSVDYEGRERVPGTGLAYWLTGKEDGKWTYVNVAPRHLDRDGVEEWKARFYELEGWDPETGWQTRATLEELGLEYVADELEAAGKLP